MPIIKASFEGNLAMVDCCQNTMRVINSREAFLSSKANILKLHKHYGGKLNGQSIYIYLFFFQSPKHGHRFSFPGVPTLSDSSVFRILWNCGRPYQLINMCVPPEAAHKKGFSGCASLIRKKTSRTIKSRTSFSKSDVN